MKKIFLAWKASCTRSHNQAKHFGAKEIYVSYFNHSHFFPLVAARYLISFFTTLWLLHQEKADVVFTLNQPPFLILAVFVYTKLLGGIYILDSHSAVFNDRKWAWARPLYRFIASRALLNINTNRHHKKLVEAWGGRSVIISDVPILHGCEYPRLEVSQNSIAVVASFMFDEPIEEIWQAAELTPQVDYYVTGNYKKLRPSVHSSTPPNIHLMGFLSTEDYFGLLSSTKGVLVLTTRDNTMQMGAYEALSLEQPIITSDWQVLRDSFGAGAVYVDNVAISIAEGVNELLSKQESYKKAAILQRKERREFFEKVRAKILEEIELVSS